MRRAGLIGICSCLFALFPPLAARADGISPSQPTAPGPFGWTGLYLGYHFGGAFGLTDISDPFGPSIFGDDVHTPGPLAGGQIGYNWQFGATVLGLEADASWADLDGTNTCFAYSGFVLSSNCRVHVDALGTLTGRVGWTLGPDGRTLLYAKGGAAWEHSETDATVNGGLGLPGTSAGGTRWGWTLGAGAEQALAAHWSLKAEYDFLAFDGGDIAVPAGGSPLIPNSTRLPAPAAATQAGVSQDMHQFKVGMNYTFGGGLAPLDRDWASGSLKDMRTWPASGLELDAGVRYVHGWGRFQKDLGIKKQGVTSLASRLTYDGMQTDGGEFYARIDTPHNWMVKGLVGAGTGSGHLNDEDWGLSGPDFPIFVPYSNTISDADNQIGYGIIDIGYDWRRRPAYRIAPFVGYAIFKQDMDASGCAQLANPHSDCVPAIPTSIKAITEDDQWQALRLGAVADFTLAPRLKLTGDVAYLPYVRFDGTDDHLLRSLVSPEWGHGTGVQLEATLSYAVTDTLSLGVGGRYWSMWTTSGDVDFGGDGTIIPMRYAAEQAAVLVQGSYAFGKASEPVPLK